jgi:hypothetical protein
MTMESANATEHAQATDHGLAGNLNSLAISATNHCLTGCVIGEVAGMAPRLAGATHLRSRSQLRWLISSGSPSPPDR